MQTEHELALLEHAAQRYPTTDYALAEIARLQGVLSMPKETIHIISDVHGEHKKLRHIINNASGSIRPMIQETFGDQLDEATQKQLLNVIYYPQQLFVHQGLTTANEDDRRPFVLRMIRLQFSLLNFLRGRVTLERFEALYPGPFRRLFRELLFEACARSIAPTVDRMLGALVHEGRGLAAVRSASHLIRNLSIWELIVAGDLGDRGPRLDKVAELLTQQPRVRLTFGNHDISWVGACLGHAALIATVVRISLRYGRLAQLEEGYGIPLASLEHLARTVYKDDPATRFAIKPGSGDGSNFRDAATLTRMQKAIAIIQFKLEAQVIKENPAFGMDDRALFSKLDSKNATVELNGVVHPLEDTFLPTVNPADATALSNEETRCVEALKRAFLHSPRLWEHITHWGQVGSMYAVRDHHVIFHGCVPVDASGVPLSVSLGGRTLSGRALFDAWDVVIRRAIALRQKEDLDQLWYLWCGPRSPLFGKHAMTTFGRYFLADESTYKEHKNPYFKLIHSADFCRDVLEDFSARADIGLIVNGHVPVKPERGEAPLKRSERAVSIDGAFSEAYGDRGYTLLLDAGHTCIAEHHHFDSIEEALHSGADIIPRIAPIQRYETPRTVADTEHGAKLEARIDVLQRLVKAYRSNAIIGPEREAPPPMSTP